MLAKLVRFVLLTRFSKPLLGVIAFFLAYDIVIRALTNSPGFSTGFSYYAVGATIFFITVSLLFGGLFILKSDRDYLLTLPLKRRDLSISLFTAQFVGSGITILFLFGFYLGGARTLEATAVLIADLAILAAVVTALGVVSNILSTWLRAGLAVILGLWCFSSILGNPFTPVSPFTGDLLYGSIVLFGLAVVIVPVALRELAYLELGSMRSMLRATSSQYKRTMSFSGRSPVRAIYSYHLSFLELVARVNLAGSTSYRATRVRTSTVLIISSALAAVYLSLGLSAFADLLSTRPVVLILPILMGVITLVLMSQATFSNERGWLAFTAMDPAVYLRHLLLSRAVSTLAIIGPFGIVNSVLAFLGVSEGVNSSIVLLITVPSASILATYLVARMGAVQQVKEEGMMPGQFDLKQFLVIIPIYIMVALIAVSEISLIGSIIIATVVGILALLMMASKSVWRGIAYRLTERGFV
ncbi:hypothetical protein E6H33_01710 [Candidatus Bathyarchaeota archaeon]|nr:MAG: hypothetical protein E6H33_01710 [Candidatus Bathyarchaeota archaeon]